MYLIKQIRAMTHEACRCRVTMNPSSIPPFLPLSSISNSEVSVFIALGLGLGWLIFHHHHKASPLTSTSGTVSSISIKGNAGKWISGVSTAPLLVELHTHHITIDSNILHCCLGPTSLIYGRFNHLCCTVPFILIIWSLPQYWRLIICSNRWHDYPFYRSYQSYRRCNKYFWP